MDENNPPNDSESFGKDEKASESPQEGFGKVRKASESGSEGFGKVRKESEEPLENQSERFGKSQESFGNIRKGSESPQERFGKVRKENHTLTIKEVLKIFESKNVDITERSVVNYCHPNRYGVSLLDCYLDQNERKYFITPESVERAIEEVKARKTRLNKENQGVLEDLRKGPESGSESFGNVRKGPESGSESFGKVPNDSETGKIEEYEKEITNLKQENLDLKITNKGKDYFIDQMKSERAELIAKVEDSARMIGELETRLQIEPPKELKTKEEENVVEVKIHDTNDTEDNGGEPDRVEPEAEEKPEDIMSEMSTWL